VKKLGIIIEEHEDLKQENHALHEELTILKREYDQVSKQLISLQRQLDRTNETKEVTKLCKLILMGSLVPLASFIIMIAFMDGSILIPNAKF
jgi:chromosome segregation ATPase